MAIFPLTNRFKGREYFGKVGTAYLRGVKLARGPTGVHKTSYKFLGKSTSYIEFPNKGKLDTKNAITIIAWIKPQKAGPIFNYQTNGWGVHFWVTSKRQLFVRFVKRNGRFSTHVAANVLRPGKWDYVAATYDQRTGYAALWKNSRVVRKTYVGKFTLRTQFNARMGARIGDGRYFMGRIACLQIYGFPLTSRQMKMVKYRCTKGMTIFS